MEKAAEKCPNLERHASLPWQPRIAPQQPDLTSYVALNSSTVKRKKKKNKEKITGQWAGMYLVAKRFCLGTF